MGGSQDGGRRDLGTLVFPNHVLAPKDLLNFTELRGFQSDWKSLGLDAEADLATLQITIMIDPTGASVIQGTGGLRKLRFSLPSWNRGKRGGLRVGYVYFPEYGQVILIVAYSKSEDAKISAKGKKMIKKLIDEEKELFRKGYYT